MLQIKPAKTSSDSGKEEAAAAARRLLKDLCIKGPRDIILEDIAMVLGAYVLEGPLIGADARLVRTKGMGVIRVKEAMGELGRKRFAIAHEIGHWVLHAEGAAVALCTEDDIVRYRGSRVELEANAFAAELLMPSASFGPRCDKASLERARELADAYNVSLTAAALRFVEECPQNCVAVFTDDAKISWFRARDEKIFLKPGMKVRSADVAGATGDPSERSRADTAVWFPNWYGRGVRRSVHQQSIRLGRYGTVLTLLRVVDTPRNDGDGDYDKD